MNAIEMNHTLDFMEELDPPGAYRIRLAGQYAAIYWMVRNWTVAEISAAALVACELQCIVEAMRYERVGGVFIAVKDGK